MGQIYYGHFAVYVPDLADHMLTEEGVDTLEN